MAWERPISEGAVGTGDAAARYALVAVSVIALTSFVLMHDVPHWVDWDFDGYEGKADFDEYAALMQTVGDLPPGRVMWEENRTCIGTAPSLPSCYSRIGVPITQRWPGCTRSRR